MKLFQLNEVLVTGTKIIASNELMVPPNRACFPTVLLAVPTQGGFKLAKNKGAGGGLSFPGVTVLWKHKVKVNLKVETKQILLKEEKDFHFIRPYS